MAQEIRSVQDWDEDIARRVEELYQARVERNSVVPINARLPPELLCTIFLEYAYLQSASDHGRGYRWMNICHVCHYWRDLAMKYPRFWQRVSLTENTATDCVEEVLTRSVDTPLVATIIFRSKEKTNPQALIMMNRILEELPRTESLCIKAHIDPMTSALNSLNQTAPLLTSLSLICLRERSNTPMPRFVPADLSKLTVLELALPGTSLDNTKHLLTPSLRELTIRLHIMPPSGALQAALSGLPHLEALRITTSLDARPESVFAERPISMPRMRTIRVIGSTWTCAYLLNSLSLPANTALYVDCAPDDATYREMDHTVIGAALGTKCYDEREGDVRPMVNLGIHCTGTRITLSGWRESDPIKLWARGFHRRMLIATIFAKAFSLETLCSSFGVSKIRTLILGNLTSVARARWASALMQMKNVENLTILNSPSSASQSLLDVLEERISQLPPTLMFPKLQNLFLSSIVFKNDSETDMDSDPDGDAETVDGDPKPVGLSFGRLKTALEFRSRENLALVGVVLTKPVGLPRECVEQLRGLVQIVKWDGDIISFGAPATTPLKMEKDGEDANVASTLVEVSDDEQVGGEDSVLVDTISTGNDDMDET